MPLTQLVTRLMLPLILSVAAMTSAALQDQRTAVAAAALVFCVLVWLAGLLINAPHWHGHGDKATHVGIMQGNIVLAALVFAWAAAAFFVIYGFTGVVWRHGLQYGTAASVIAAGFLLYARRLSAVVSTPPHPALNIAHGVAVAAGLVFLIGSGKLATQKGDWAANDIFLFGGLALLGLCIIAAVTQRRLAAYR